MKKIVALILFLTISISSFAQIQRKIFGCTLGVTRLPQVEKILETNYKNPWFDGSKTYFYLENIEYGGYMWSKVTFNFYNKVLSSVTFSGFNLVSVCDFSGMESSLSSRYSKYKTNGGYDDGTTIISTSFNQLSNGYNSATIKYEHKPFVKQKKVDNDNAW